MAGKKASEPLKVGDLVKIRNSGFKRARIVELRVACFGWQQCPHPLSRARQPLHDERFGPGCFHDCINDC